jgi:thiol-disulfide isomerase/thioredoxin
MNIFNRKRFRWLLLIVVFFCVLRVHGQSIGAVYEELKVGEKMPDISLGTVMNNVTRKMRFADFKGKLIILDFWTSSCSFCIASFPYMSDLQNKFGDKIQIFLVNPLETEEQIKIRMEQNPYWKNKSNLFPANLPILTNAKELGALFPIRVGVPYHVWIDGEGIVRIRGQYINTTEKKITEILSGKEISFVKDGNSGTKLPLYVSLNRAPLLSLKSSSIITNYIDSLGNEGGGPILLDQMDSAAQTVRNTYINCDLLTLYQLASNDLIEVENSPRMIAGERLMLLVKDTLQYSSDRMYYKGKMTDDVFVRSKFCYEQIRPIRLSAIELKQYMLQDLNQYFGVLYGTSGKIERRRIPCWILIRSSISDKLQHTAAGKVRKVSQRGNEKKMNQNEGEEFKEVISSFFRVLPRVTKNILSHGDIIIDETGYSGKVDMIFPSWEDLKNVDDVKKALRKYNLDLVQGERELNVLVIEEK